MAEIRDQVADLLQDGWEACTVDEVRVEHEAETRCMWLPKGKRTRLYVDRKKASRSFLGALSLTTRKMRIYPIQGNQNAEQITLMMDRLQRETDEGKKIAVVLDNARFHHAKALNDLYAPGRALERITPIYSTCPRTPPTSGPTEHVWNATKNNIANSRALAPQNTLAALTAHITNRTFNHDFEHIPITPPHTDLI